MLPEAHPMKYIVHKSICSVLVASFALLGCSTSFAQAVPSVSASSALGLAQQFMLFGGAGAAANSKAAENAAEAGAQAAKDLTALAVKKPPQDLVDFGTAAQRRVDSIADPKIQADRDKILKFLGINPKGDSSLFVFLSWSMPLPLMRSYAIEAMWSGATLVFKGVPPGKELGTFVLKDLRQLVYDKGASANISIDPRLFDEYNVSVVPSIVLTRSLEPGCGGGPKKEFTYNDKKLFYVECPPVNESKYDKIEGAVTVSYALETFEKGGSSSAREYLAAISKGWFNKESPGKTQKSFTGKWKDVLSPAEVQAAEEAAGFIGTSATPRMSPKK
jgi:type-F conjugative transfer system pilin assembly protein TrbC